MNTRMLSTLALFVIAGAAWTACEDSDSASELGILSLKDGVSLDGNTPCKRSSECQDGMYCARLKLESIPEPICVDIHICDLLSCSSGFTCVNRTSDPAQVGCVPSTSSTEPGGDEVPQGTNPPE